MKSAFAGNERTTGRPGALVRRGHGVGLLCGAIGALVLAFQTTPPGATPPEYRTFDRDQRAAYTPDEDELLRVFIVFIEQGDGIVIQLPQKFSYGPGTGDTDDDTERIEIVIDGGSVPTSQSSRMGRFVEDILAGDRVVEHTVVTHHDQDHIVGFTEMLGDDDITFSHVYHNGLASWRPGRRGFPVTGAGGRTAVRDRSRCMCFVGADGAVDAAHVIDDLRELRTAVDADELQGVYEDLARNIVARADQQELSTFARAFVGAPFVDEVEAAAGVDLGDLTFDVLWPERTLRAYGGTNWGQTINGNSVTFVLRYREFTMLLCGDHNELSEEALLEHLGPNSSDLACDVLKVPHHGSRHGLEAFFRTVDPVIAVCSMGDKGFRSKAMSSAAWEHPSTDVIQWVGGAHRFYSTFIHERRFRYEDIDTEAKRERMIERAHILIETDGAWFRVVEIPADDPGLGAIPSVQATRRGNGTRWIKASE